MEPALGADQHRERRGRRRIGGAAKGRHRIAHGRVLVAEHEQALRFQRVEAGGQAGRLADLGHGKDAALLGRLDRVGLKAVELEPLALGEAGEDRLQPPGAHLHRLLRHVVEPSRLQGGEQVVQVGRRRLRPGLRHHAQIRALAALRHDLGAPLAVAAVEQQDGLALGPAQDGQQVIGLRPLQREDAAFRQIRFDEEARGGEIVGGHGLSQAGRSRRVAALACQSAPGGWLMRKCHDSPVSKRFPRSRPQGGRTHHWRHNPVRRRVPHRNTFKPLSRTRRASAVVVAPGGRCGIGGTPVAACGEKDRAECLPG